MKVIPRGISRDTVTTAILLLGGWYMLWLLYYGLSIHDWYTWPSWIVATLAYGAGLYATGVKLKIWWDAYKVKRAEDCDSSTT